MAFQYPMYYPGGGMNDFLSDHDTQEEAILALKENEIISMYEQGHIYDCEERKIVWETSDPYLYP